MADISVMNVGGTDYNIKDSTSRTNSTKAMSLPAYYETGNTASQAYSIVGTPINWKGTLYYTKTTVAKGATWTVGTNLTAATNLGKLVRNIKTYVGSDSKLHFVDLTGADTALNFSSNTYGILPIKTLVSTSHATKINGGSTIATNNDIAILHDGVVLDGWDNTGKVAYWESVNSSPVTLKVTFDKTIKKIIAVQTYAESGHAGVYNPFILYNSSGTVLSSVSGSSSNTYTTLMANGLDGIDINSNTWTFKVSRAGAEHMGTSEFRFYGIY